MAIATAVQRGIVVEAYDHEGRLLVTLPTGSGAKDGLQGYTSSSINIRIGSWIYVYDEEGRQISMVPAT